VVSFAAARPLRLALVAAVLLAPSPAARAQPGGTAATFATGQAADLMLSEIDFDQRALFVASDFYRKL